MWQHCNLAASHDGLDQRLAQAPPLDEGDLCSFAQENLPLTQAFVDISVSLWLRKPRQRFAQGQPKG